MKRNDIPKIKIKKPYNYFYVTYNSFKGENLEFRLIHR